MVQLTGIIALARTTYTHGQIHPAMRVQHESLPVEVASLLKTHEKRVAVFRCSNKFYKATC